MNVLYYIVLILHLIACFFLIAVVLLQQGKGQDLASAFGGGGTQAAFGPRGSATVLTRATTILASVFMITSLSLALIGQRRESILEKAAPPVAASPTPVTGPTNVLGISTSPTPAPSPAASVATTPAATTPAAPAQSPIPAAPSPSVPAASPAPSK